MEEEGVKDKDGEEAEENSGCLGEEGAEEFWRGGAVIVEG